MRVSIGIIIHQRGIYCKQCMAVGEFLQAVPYFLQDYNYEIIIDIDFGIML